MSISLPPLLSSFVDSMNGGDPVAFTGLFASDAIVHDEGYEYRGPAAIHSWIEDAIQKYRPVLEVTAFTESPSEATLVGMVSGTFDGSPVELCYRLTLAGGKIASLAISPS